MSGAFQTSREIFENPIWQNVVEFRLFFLIYGKAIFREEGYKQGSVFIGKGQWLRSYRNLQSDLEYIENRSIKRYSLSRIKRAIDSLVKNERIEIKETELGTLFTVVNYAKYQGLDNYKKHNENAERTGRERRENAERTQREQQRNNNKKEKKEKKDKKDIYGGRKEIFEHYLSLNLIKHKKYTPAMDLAIKTAMKNNGYTVEDCKTLLDRHKKAVEATKGSEYSIRARPLHEFFGQKAYQAKHLICADYEEGGKYYDLQRPRRKQGPKKQMDFNQFPQHEYTEDELDSLFEKIEVEEINHG